jgi:hypothetical protein
MTEDRLPRTDDWPRFSAMPAPVISARYPVTSHRSSVTGRRPPTGTPTIPPFIARAPLGRRSARNDDAARDDSRVYLSTGCGAAVPLHDGIDRRERRRRSANDRKDDDASRAPASHARRPRAPWRTPPPRPFRRPSPPAIRRASCALGRFPDTARRSSARAPRRARRNPTRSSCEPAGPGSTTSRRPAETAR